MSVSIHGTGTIIGIDQGIQISGVSTFSNNVSIGGTLTYEDVTNVDSIGIITARGGIDAEGGSITSKDYILGAISTTISDTATDIFVYDTSKDSDGGAWRKRTTNTSWYNETLNTATRGSRREFPSVAVIVVETGQVTIYDGDDPDLPMWMVFNQSSQGGSASTFLANSGQAISSIFMLNGELGVGFPSVNGWGLSRINFLSDSQTWYWTSATHYKQVKNLISQRNLESGYGNAGTGISGLNSAQVNDVAMTVLPNAPIDDATGLPVPTIALGTSQHVNVITHDGKVYEVTGFNPVSSVGFSDDKLFIHTVTSGPITYAAIGRRELYGDIGLQDWEYGNQYNYNATPWANWIPKEHTKAILTPTNEIVFGGNTSGLYRLQTDDNVESNGSGGGAADDSHLDCAITTSYNTGWISGEQKGVFLSDTDTTDLTAGSNLIPASSADFSSSSGWNLGTGWTISGGKLNKTTTDNNTAYYSVSGLTVGQAYTFSIDVDTVPSSGNIYFYALGEYTPWPTLTTTGTHTLTVVANSTALAFGITGISGNGCVLDNVSVTVGDADRSAYNRGTKVVGTVTKSAVATGAELVAYSGFTASNYLTFDASNMNFGTGDFSVSFWCIPSSDSTNEFILELDDASAGSNRLYILVTATAQKRLYLPWDTDVAGSELTIGEWNHVVVGRQNGMGVVYVNGEWVSDGNKAWTVDLQGNGYGTISNYSGGVIEDYAWSGSLALLRITGTAPSAAQVKKMFNDEMMLFQENAKATLYGSSDVVTALAYDEVTDRLHVGTSAGRSDFQGLRRINNTTTAVTTAISASDELIAEQ